MRVVEVFRPLGLSHGDGDRERFFDQLAFHFFHVGLVLDHPFQIGERVRLQRRFFHELSLVRRKEQALGGVPSRRGGVRGLWIHGANSAKKKQVSGKAKSHLIAGFLIGHGENLERRNRDSIIKSQNAIVIYLNAVLGQERLQSSLDHGSIADGQDVQEDNEFALFAVFLGGAQIRPQSADGRRAERPRRASNHHNGRIIG